MQSQLIAAEELSDRLQEAQILSGNVESMFSDLQVESKAKIEKMQEDRKVEIEELQNKLRKSQTEHISLESVIEEQQQELIKQRKECETMQDQLRMQADQNVELMELRKAISVTETSKKDLEEKLRKSEIACAESLKKIEELQQKVTELAEANNLLVANLEKKETSLTLAKAKVKEIELEKEAFEEQVQTFKSLPSEKSVSFWLAFKAHDSIS